MIATVALALALLTGAPEVDPDTLPRCSDVDLSEWTPEDGQVCLAEDDPGWTPEDQEDWAEDQIDVVVYPDPKVIVLDCDGPDVIVVEDPTGANTLPPPFTWSAGW